jgi:predicted ATPase/DNA-binding SARP family transcriptional activator
VSSATICVLGPVQVVGDDGPVPLASKHRLLLAALVTANGRSCSVDELADALWGEAAPASARKLVQVYVSQLRRSLPASVGIVTLGSAYSLELPPELLDAARCERLVGEAVAARRDDNPALAASLAEQASELWRGRAYADLRYASFLQPEIERLEELRLAALEERFEAQLALGRHAETLAEVLGLAGENPLRERLQQQAMLALYRSGRQSEALELYTALHRRLDEELGLEPGSELRALQRRILQQDPTLDVAAHVDAARSLPEPPNRLVGREAELEALAALLQSREARLLVLTGAGGSGKTRLALEAARRAASSFANGAALVELAPLRDPQLVLPTIAQVLGIADVHEPMEALAEALRSQDLLLVVDNAEHVLETAPAFVELLARAPRLTMLITSRTVLHLSGERVFPVAPLDVDAAQALFEERARALQPDFRLTPANGEAVRELCRRVDGLPLAVELAAARVRALSPQAVLDRLTERLSFLAGGPHDLPARQHTLYETLDWSYELLPTEQRGLLARLSVFRGGATLEAAARVCLEGDESRALDLVESLADASLLIVRHHGDETRYDLLETVRQYAADRLRDMAEEEVTRRRHAAWLIELAERAEPHLRGEEQTLWFTVLETEHDNARAALAHLLSAGEQDAALRLTVLLSRFWYVRGHLTEARRQLDTVLRGAVGLDPHLLRRAQTAGASITLLQGDYAASEAFAERALDSARRTGETKLIANALSNLGAIVLAGGDEQRAALVLEEAVALARDAGDARITALALNNLGDLSLATGDYRRAGPLFEESHALLRSLGDTANIARSLFNLGAVDLMLGVNGAAASRFRESLDLARAAQDKEDLAWCLEGFAALSATSGDWQRAASLVGAADTLLRQIGADFKPFERRLHESTVADVRGRLDPAAFHEAMARGASMSLAEALDLAMGASEATERAPAGLRANGSADTPR